MTKSSHFFSCQGKVEKNWKFDNSKVMAMPGTFECQLLSEMNKICGIVDNIAI